MAERRRSTVDDPLLKEVQELKRLLMLLLLKAGTYQEEIATALQVDQSAVSRMFPKRSIKPFGKAKQK